MKPIKNKMVRARISANAKQCFEKICARRGTTVSKALIQFIEFEIMKEGLLPE